MPQTIETKEFKEGNVELGVVIGLLLTDGWVSKNKSSWQIGFTNRSEELHELFKEKIKKIFGDVHFTTTPNSKNKGIKVTTLTSKKIGDFLHSFTPSFRKKAFTNGTFSNCKLPDFFFNLSKEEIKQVLSAMFSADGGVTLSVGWRKRNVKCRINEGWEIKREIILGCKNPRIKKQIIKLLEKLGFNPREDKIKIVLEKKRDIIKFKNEIGFIDGVKISKSNTWKGFEKNQILDLAIKTMELKKKDLKQFKNKEEVVNFLKSLITN
jgi:hypothetical protein